MEIHKGCQGIFPDVNLGAAGVDSRLRFAQLPQTEIVLIEGQHAICEHQTVDRKCAKSQMAIDGLKEKDLPRCPFI